MILFVSDAFIEQYVGGAELTTEAIIGASFFPVNKITSKEVNLNMMEEYKNAFWIFGNFSGLSRDCLLYAIRNLNYSIIEYDYKFCAYRSIEKHQNFEKVCNCHEQTVGKLVATFLAKSKMNFWMSQKQLEIYQSIFPFIKNNTVLSSVFSKDTLKYLENLKTNKKNNRWVILDSPSWIKGREAAIDFAKKHKLEYELVWGLDYKDMLTKLASSKGLIFLPLASDTCPRIVIEAKILGCELVLNDHVQHREEDWFKNRESTLTYLKSRADHFWRVVEKVAAPQLNFSVSDSTPDHKFKFIIPFYNVERWIDKCITSLKKQKYKNFECYLIDDLSTDSTAKVANNLIKNDNRFKLIKNTTKQYALGNIYKTINKIKCRDDDVIILLDGDDWLASSYSLNILSNTYKEKDCLMTYGSYVYNPSGVAGVEPSKYPDEVVKNNLYRKDSWRASHLRSFKYKLWKHLREEDLKDDEDQFFEMAYDQAIMLPLLEMASDRAEYISDVLYVYNKENPLNVDKIKAQQQTQVARFIRQKQKYQKLE